MSYTRIQVSYCGKTGKPVGIFGACHHLRRKCVLSQEDDALFQQIDDWFTEYLPEPPFYKEGNPDKAITWFKIKSAGQMLHILNVLVAILDKYGIEYEYARTENPGRIIYEDKFQVATV